MVIVLLLSVLIGLSLGLMGGGGSILAVPVLKYVAGLEAKAAIATSLLVVGTTAGVGGWRHAKQGNVAWRTGTIFAVTAMVGAYGGGLAADWFSGPVLLMLFALMMLVTSVMMLKGRGELEPRKDDMPEAETANVTVRLILPSTPSPRAPRPSRSSTRRPGKESNFPPTPALRRTHFTPGFFKNHPHTRSPVFFLLGSLSQSTPLPQPHRPRNTHILHKHISRLLLWRHRAAFQLKVAPHRLRGGARPQHARVA